MTHIMYIGFKRKPIKAWMYVQHVITVRYSTHKSELVYL